MGTHERFAPVHPYLAWCAPPLAGLGIVLALMGQWAAAGVCAGGGAALLWLSGGWVIGGGPRSYLQRVVRVWDDFALASATAYATADRRDDPLAARTPPDRFAAEHERLLELELEAQEGRRDPDQPFHRRARAVVAALEGIARLSEHLDASAHTPEEQAYAAGVAERLAVRREAYAVAAIGAERNGEAALARLSRLRPPREVAADNAELVRAFGAQLDATRALHIASRELDATGVAAAARDHESTSDALSRAWERIGERLGT